MNKRRIVVATLLPAYNMAIEEMTILGPNQEEPLKRPKQWATAHQDLVDAFQDLRIDLATLCEQGQYTEFEDKTLDINKYFVSTIEFSGKAGEETVTLYGHRMLAHNQTLALETPPVKLNQNSKYAYWQSMEEKVMHAMSETDQYIDGKHAPSNQVEMFADDGSPAPEAEMQPKRGRGRPRKVVEPESALGPEEVAA